MNKTFWVGLFCSLISPHISFAQEYSYTHYGVAEGLASSTLYCITQDKEGFIWIGTETGVSRFDGTRFKNFTTKDGLPDLEILQIFGDSKGRVWMAPFRKSICFYFKGKIHNAENDSLLSRIHLRGNVEGFAEDANGNILLQERSALHLVNSDGSLVQIDSLDLAPIRQCLAVSASLSGHFLVQVAGKIVEFSGKGLIHSMAIPFSGINPNEIAMTCKGAVWFESATVYTIRSFLTADVIHLPRDYWHFSHISFSMLADSLVYLNQLSGSFEYNVNTRQTRVFLPGTIVNRVFRDASGNLWFLTRGAGLFRLNSNDVKTISLTVGQGEMTNVTAVKKIGHELWVGDSHNYIFKLSLPDLVVREKKPFPYYSTCRILFLDTVGNDMIVAGSDYGVIVGTRGLQYLGEIKGTIKSAVRIGDHKLLLATSWGAGILDMSYFQEMDTLWRERSTAVFYKEDTIYIGTLNGLYRSVKGRSLELLGEGTPFLRKRISSIAESADGTVWVGSYDDAGIIGYKNNNQVIAITQKEGLTSDICRTLLVHNNTLWVGTDKGLNRIELDKPGYPVTKYTGRDGLASDMVNTVLVDSTMVYVGTSAGLSYFNEKKLMTGEECRLYLLSLMNSGRERVADTANLIIPYTDKRIRFEFAGISYRSAGDITYRYRMAGLDSTWQETKENVIEYLDLPAGNYEWQLIAVNKFGNRSRLLNVPVKVTIQVWKRAWFVAAIWLLSLAILWLLVSRRITRIRRQQGEKERLMQKMSELENMALQAQMNPHFIFNCLNSIQQFILTGNSSGANKYIAGLARLIRITLNNSSRAFICIEDEVDYLSSYLSLEKLRFKDKIDYAITVDPSIDQSAVLIPPMLVQPYVENGLLHGLGNKTEESGFISIGIVKDKDKLMITIEDNGPGRGAGAMKKNVGVGGHAPRGMSLTDDRVALMNKLYGGDTHVEFIDLKDDAGGSVGTRVVISLPFFQERSLYF